MIDGLAGRIEEELARLDLPSGLPELYSPIAYTLEKGGKRIRPLLLMIAAKMFGADLEKAMHQALAVEIFHNFTLVHDDIMDNAPLRRGRPSVYHKWDQNTAILSGDVMFSLAFKQAINCEEDVLPEVIQTFTDMTIKVCEGQQMDMNFEKRNDVSLEEYLEMIGLKTAYLLAGSLKLGAILGRASQNAADAMFDYGMLTGTAFQLMDDYLDAYGNPEKFGKQVGGDILSGKKTFLYIQTKKRLNEEDLKKFEETFNSNHIEKGEKIKLIKSYFDKSGASEEIRNMANELLKKSARLLSSLEVDEKSKEELINLTNQLTKRDK